MKSSAVASVNTIKINSKQRWDLIKYDDILGEVKTKAENFRSTAKEYVPKLYEALHNENPYIAPHNARERIEKDLVGIWSKRTILDALPDEAKDPEKQKAGRLSQKEHNSAAFSAATTPKKTKKIIVDIQGRPIEEENLESIADRSCNILTPNKEGLNKQIESGLECPSCQELYTEVIELREVVKKTTTLQNAADMLASSLVSPIIGNQIDAVDFEFPLHFGIVHTHMDSIYQKVGDGGKVWFSGKIDKRTGKVISAKIGRIELQDRGSNNRGDL